MSLRILIYLFLLAIISTYGLVNYKKLTSPFKPLIALISYTLFSEVMCRILAVKYHNNMIMYHIMLLVEYPLMATIYSRLFTVKNIQRFIRYSVIPFVVLLLANSLLVQKIRFSPFHVEFPSHILFLANGLYLIYSLLLFEAFLHKPSDIPIYKQAAFWFNTAILTLSSTLFLQLGLQNYFVRNGHKPELIDTIGYLINLLSYVLIGIAFYTDVSRLKQPVYESN
ncbi:hypothetical protein QE417_003675 [Mucilaginibacter terrae]|uniref:Cytochrome c oxidase assembly protein n=1 Tax=Mucilaginibacter terrae TaxID=1955052 RepID=A0ABU3GXV9_9SPHI|nr:hypothetical protein [Mucilaginibacter terrae]